jgi:alginate O-acetyltransferase complex protein AlgI
MNFVSWAFVALLIVVMTARVTIGRRKTEGRFVAVLLAASLVFYAWHIPIYLLVLLASSGVDYLAGLLIARHPAGAPIRRVYLVASLVANLGLLAVFKYADFGAQAAESVGAWLGADLRLPDLGLVLPMGISFYTFQSLSYTIDVYRNTLAPIRSYPKFLLFISFFPQLVAGPIVRASEFVPQMPRPRRLHLRAFHQGAWLIVLGFFLKMVCADNLAAYVDEHWTRGMQPGTSATFALWLGLMFSGQIFADFCGYSTIAQGLGYWLGYRFPDNFNAPYIAGTFKNFWERWHMTLSRWLRDYLYVPLGGNRGSRARTAMNLLIVMLLGGLWHGAAYTYIVWGAIHGACLIVERTLGLHRRADRPWAVTAGWAAVVQIAVLLAWIVFRSPTIEGAGTFVANLATGAWIAPEAWMLEALGFLAPLVVMHAVAWVREHGPLPRVMLVPATRAVLAALMAYAILTGHGGTSEFIYFQF